MRIFLPLLSLVCLSPVALAAESLEQAEQQLAALDYSAAVTTAQTVVSRGGNAPDALVRAYALLGKALAGLGRNEDARRYFKLLLAVDPKYKLDDSVSPKIRKPLVDAMADWAGRPALTVVHRPPTTSRADQPLVLKVSVVEDPMQLVKGASVTYRMPGLNTISTIGVAGDAREVVIAIPLPALGAKPGRLRYHLDILDQNNNSLARKGSPDHPLQVTLTEVAAPQQPLAAVDSSPSGPAWYRRWWVWAIAGAVVAGATTAAVVVATRPTESDVALTWEIQR